MRDELGAATVVVVGGGVVGASVAYHLAARGVRDVVVLDRAARAGAGSTGRATGGFRVQFSSAVNVRLSLLSREKLRRFADETGGDCGYVPAGYLWIARSVAELDSLRGALAVQRAHGVDDAAEVDSAAIAELNPAVHDDAIAGGTFCASDGFIRPLGILEGYRRAAERLGARFAWDTHVIGFSRERGRIVAVETTRGRVDTGHVVNAAGAWAAPLARLAGVALPVEPLRRQVAITAPTDALPREMPMSIWVCDGFHLRVRDGRVLLLLPAPGARDPFDDVVEPTWIDAVTRIARERVPALRDVAIDRDACWAGLYEMTPDGHAILGTAREPANLIFVNGSSGHGVMHAPALGQLVSEIIVDGAAQELDVEALRPERFAEAASRGIAELL